MSANGLLKKKLSVIARVEDEGATVLLYDIDTSRMGVTNRVGHFIWGLCDGTRNKEQIAEEVAARFRVSVDVARQDVMKFVAQMVDLGILEMAATGSASVP